MFKSVRLLISDTFRRVLRVLVHFIGVKNEQEIIGWPELSGVEHTICRAKPRSGASGRNTMDILTGLRN